MANYLYHGEESYLIQKEICSVKKAFSSEYDFGLEELKDKEPVEKLIDAYLSTGLFSPRKLIIYHGLPSIREDYIDHFMKIFKEEQAGVDLYIVVSSKIDKRLKLSKYLLKTFKVKEFKKLEIWHRDECIRQLIESESSRGFELSGKAADHLVDKIGINLWQLFSCLERIETAILPERVIEKEHIDHYVTGGEKSYFDMVDFFRKRVKKDLMVSITNIKKPEESFVLINMLSKHIRLLMMIMVLQKQRRSANDIASQTGKSPYYLKKIIPDVKKWTFNELKSFCESLLELEYLSKSGKIDPNLGLVSLSSKV